MGKRGFTIIEVITAMAIFAAIAGLSSTFYSRYQKRIGPERAADLVGYHVSLARAYAVQRRAPVSLVANSDTRELVIRSVSGETLRTLSLGAESAFRVDALSIGFPGDSVTFDLRGICLQCGLSGSGGIRMGSGERQYQLEFNALGVWKKERIAAGSALGN